MLGKVQRLGNESGGITNLLYHRVRFRKKDAIMLHLINYVCYPLRFTATMPVHGVLPFA
jgi:hypothetical protein